MSDMTFSIHFPWSILYAREVSSMSFLLLLLDEFYIWVKQQLDCLRQWNWADTLFLMKSLLFMLKFQHKRTNCFFLYQQNVRIVWILVPRWEPKKSCMEDLSLTRVIYDGKVEYGMWYEVCFPKESRPLKTASRRAPRNGCFFIY